MQWREWYDGLIKPGWTPEPSTIGLIWQILYPIILLTFGYVFVQAIRKKLPWQVAIPFAINFVANLLFTPIQFGLRNLPLAAADILIVLDHDSGDDAVGLETPSLGRDRAGALSHLGIAGNDVATLDHLVEPLTTVPACITRPSIHDKRPNTACRCRDDRSKSGFWRFP